MKYQGWSADVIVSQKMLFMDWDEIEGLPPLEKLDMATSSKSFAKIYRDEIEVCLPGIMVTVSIQNTDDLVPRAKNITPPISEVMIEDLHWEIHDAITKCASSACDKWLSNARKVMQR